MKIVQLTAENIKRLVAVEIKPDSNLVEITGKNGQGKTSILDAILWAMAGNKVIQSKPIRDGEESGYVRLDLGEYIITKKFKRKADGDITVSLTVENRDGAKYSSPQDLLNKFLGDLTFDPLAFSRMKPRDQVKALRALVPDYDFDDAEQRSTDIFNSRTDINRQIRDLKGRIDAIIIPKGEAVEKVSVESLVQELQDAMHHNSKVSQAEIDRATWIRDISSIDSERSAKHARIVAIEDEARRQVSALKEEIETLGRTQNELKKKLEAHVAGEPIDVQAIRARIDEADATNAMATRSEEKDRLRKEMAEKQALSDEHTKQIETIAAASAKAVIDAQLPVAGLSLTDTEVLFNGQPFEQASDAEQLRASIAIAGAMNPTLRVIRVRDGSLLDQESMDLLTRYADEHDMQVWIETVSSGRETAVVIESGSVAGAHLEAAE